LSAVEACGGSLALPAAFEWALGSGQGIVAGRDQLTGSACPTELDFDIFAFRVASTGYLLTRNNIVVPSILHSLPAFPP